MNEGCWVVGLQVERAAQGRRSGLVLPECTTEEPEEEVGIGRIRHALQEGAAGEDRIMMPTRIPKVADLLDRHIRCCVSGIDMGRAGPARGPGP